MNVSLADFDWISILFLIIAGLVGVIKGGNKQKKSPHPVFAPYAEEEEERREEEFCKEEKAIDEEEYSEPSFPTTDYYRERPSRQEKSTPEEDEKEATPYFDIRQAVISSEILKRPEY